MVKGMESADLIVHSAKQMITMAGQGPRVGAAMATLGIVVDGAMAISGEHILAVGSSSEILGRYRAAEYISAAGRVVTPGFVDPHTHLVFAGDRANEFEMRLGGATYLDIMRAGGGIMSTVRATREASLEALVEQSLERLDRMILHGTTTAEVKTGYGLTTADEIRMLAAISVLDAAHAIDLVPTFLGAHAIPEEYADRAEDYVDLVVSEMLPQVLALAGEEADADVEIRPPVFCDVFCDEGAFDLAQTRRILEAAKAAGLGLKVHADEFANLGAASLAAELGATSADHLVHTSAQDMAAMAKAGVIGVLLPGTSFGLGQHNFATARALIAAGVPIALGTDLNPGTCWCESMPFIMALACRYMGMSPAEALVASTINAAYAIGLGDEVGCLEPGKLADVVVHEVPDYRYLAYRFGTNPVCAVIKRGKVVVSAR